MDLVDLVNHLLIFSGCETPENLVMEAGNSAPPILSQTHANTRTQTLKKTRSLIYMLYLVVKQFQNNVGLEVRRPSSP